MDDGDMDSLFSTFMNEVGNIKSNKMKKIEEKAGNPEEIVERLSSMRYDPRQGFGSAYQVLGISPEASESEVSKAYKKLSVLIHPDKCKLEKASEAFQVLAKAYSDTKDPNYQDKYKDIIQEAKARVRKAREQENKTRAKKGEDPLEMDGHEFDQDVLKECERMTTESTESKVRGNEVYEANMKRQEELIKEARMRKREIDQEKKKFDKGRDKRAAGWQTFMNNVETKKFKSGTFQKIGQVGAGNRLHRQEERREIDGKAEIDLDDKHVAKSDTQAGRVGIDKSYQKSWR